MFISHTLIYNYNWNAIIITIFFLSYEDLNFSDNLDGIYIPDKFELFFYVWIKTTSRWGDGRLTGLTSITRKLILNMTIIKTICQYCQYSVIYSPVCECENNWMSHFCHRLLHSSLNGFLQLTELIDFVTFTAASYDG